MEPEGIHELTAAYALNALDPAEETEYEEHLRHCPRCREELAGFQEAAASLAYAVEGPAPPRGLGDRIVDAALAERSNVVPLRRRWVTPTLGAVAAAAAGVAIGLGVWASSLSGSLDDERQAVGQHAEVIGLLVSQGAAQVPLAGATGTLVVAESGEGALVFTGLEPAPEGKTYEIWVIEEGVAKPAGLFEGGGEMAVVPIEQPVPTGAVVAVTVEPEGGVDAPTTEPFAVTPTV
jgi:anti-sigma-K factor RskA